MPHSLDSIEFSRAVDGPAKSRNASLWKLRKPSLANSFPVDLCSWGMVSINGSVGGHGVARAGLGPGQRSACNAHLTRQETGAAVSPRACRKKGELMKRSWTTLAVAFAALFAAAGCGGTCTTFQVNTGATLTFLSPADATAGGQGFTLTVNGSGFVNNTVVQWNGKNRTTTFVSATQVTAAINTADIASAGTIFVQTLNPNPAQGGNGISVNSIAFVIHPSTSASAVAQAATAAAGDSPAISGDGRFVAYTGVSGERTQI